MQRQIFREKQNPIKCKNCRDYIPDIHFYRHQRQCQLSRSDDSSYSSDESERRRRFFGLKNKASNRNINNKQRKSDQREGDSVKQCKHCHKKYPYGFIYQHESFCHKNQVANELRKQFQDSSNQDDQHYKGESSSSDENKRQRQDIGRQRQDIGRQRQDIGRQRQDIGRQRETFFTHRPRRNYRLSQTSSEEDQSEQYWRSFHQNTIMSSAHNLCIKMYKTRLENITLVLTTNGETGNVLKRVVYNELTGQRKQISEHRYLRHYAMHVIDSSEPRSNAIYAQNNNQQSQDIQRQIQQALQQLSINLNRLQGNTQTGMKKQQLSVFQKWKYQAYKQENDRCLICLQGYVEADYLLTLKCFHSFHESCVVKWLQQNASCPLCKTKQNEQ